MLIVVIIIIIIIILAFGTQLSQNKIPQNHHSMDVYLKRK
jgi:hypothetical protein